MSPLNSAGIWRHWVRNGLCPPFMFKMEVISLSLWNHTSFTCPVPIMTIKFPIFKPSYSQSWARPYSNITGSQAWWPTFKILFKVGEFIGLQFNKMENSWGVQSWHYHNCAIHLSLFDIWKIKCMFLIGFHKDLTFKPICSCWDTHMAIGLRGVSAWMPIRVVSTWTPHVQGVL